MADCACTDCGGVWDRVSPTQSRYCPPCKKIRQREYFSTNMEGRAKKIASDARRRAKATGLPYHLRWDWIRDVLEAGRCQLTGLPFDLRMTALGRGPRNPFAPSLDRIVPRLGYTDQNCRVILMAVNTAIGCWGEGVTEHIIRAWIERIDER